MFVSIVLFSSDTAWIIIDLTNYKPITKCQAYDQIINRGAISRRLYDLVVKMWHLTNDTTVISANFHNALVCQ